jgi:hypothetical protein
MTRPSTHLLDASLANLDVADRDVLAYVTLRKSRFRVAGRRLRFDGQQFISSLELERGDVRKDIQSSSAAFHQCALSHLFSTSGMLLYGEIPQSGSHTIPAGSLSVEVRCGLLDINSENVKYLELFENANARTFERSYRLWLSTTTANSLTTIPSDPSLHIIVKTNDQIGNQLLGHIDRVLPFQIDNEECLEITGVDRLFGTRIQISGRFNFQVETTFSITVLAAWVQPSRIVPGQALRPVVLSGIERYMKDRAVGSREFCEFLAATKTSQESEAVKGLCDYFGRVLTETPQRYSPLTATAFKNAAILLDNKVPAHVVIGSVDGIDVEGITQIAPGVLVAAPDQLPIVLIGEPSNLPLCREWNPTSARLITFIRAETAPETTTLGWIALKDAFDRLLVVTSDASWRHSDKEGNNYILAVDGHVQDAVLELDRNYHVHNLFSGTAHQYHSGRQKSTHRLHLDEHAATAIRERLTPLDSTLATYGMKFPELVAHLSNAIVWISRARSSVTASERFLCAWIAVEFLAAYGKSAGSAIKSTVSSRVSYLMARGDRNLRRYWQSAMEDCYDLRCDLVHDAKDNSEQLEKRSPMLMQAVVDVVLFCILSIPNLTKDTSPSEMLDDFRNLARNR